MAPQHFTQNRIKRRFKKRLLTFIDASHDNRNGQLCYIIVLVLPKVSHGMILHVPSQTSHKSPRPDKFTAAAEIIAAFEAIHELVTIHSELEKLLEVKIYFWKSVDTKDLYSYLSSTT